MRPFDGLDIRQTSIRLHRASGVTNGHRTRIGTMGCAGCAETGPRNKSRLLSLFPYFPLDTLTGISRIESYREGQGKPAGSRRAEPDEETAMKASQVVKMEKVNGTEKDLVDSIATSILSNGWRGDALVVCSELSRLVTGSHRQAAVAKLVRARKIARTFEIPTVELSSLIGEQDWASIQSDRDFYELCQQICFEDCCKYEITLTI